MKKITLSETDLLKIVNKVLNEQELRQFDEDEIDLLHFIFERELKPPFRRINEFRTYYNRDNEWIGQLTTWDGYDKPNFLIRNSVIHNIKFKVCQVFKFPYDTADWWLDITPHLKFWMEDQLNIEFNGLNIY